MSGGIFYIGSKISFIFKVQICYEGIFYIIDIDNFIVVFVKVRFFGIEDCFIDRFVFFREEIYEYIIFWGSDIKDIIVCEFLKVQYIFLQDFVIVQFFLGFVFVLFFQLYVFYSFF